MKQPAPTKRRDGPVLLAEAELKLQLVGAESSVGVNDVDDFRHQMRVFAGRGYLLTKQLIPSELRAFGKHLPELVELFHHFVGAFCVVGIRTNVRTDAAQEVIARRWASLDECVIEDAGIEAVVLAINQRYRDLFAGKPLQVFDGTVADGGVLVKPLLAHSPSSYPATDNTEPCGSNSKTIVQKNQKVKFETKLFVILKNLCIISLLYLPYTCEKETTMNGNDGLLTIMETKQYLCEHGIPAEGRTLQIRVSKDGDSDDSRWPFVLVDNEFLINRHELDKIIEQLPRWLFVIVNRDLESRCGYMAIPHIQNDFGLTRPEILEAIESGRVSCFDRGTNLHPVLRYLVNRGAVFELVEEIAERRRNRAEHSTPKGAHVMNTKPLSLRQFYTQYRLSKIKFKELIEQGLLPLDSNGKAGTALRYTVTQDVANHILADKELLTYLKNAGSRLTENLRQRLESGVIFDGEAPTAPPPPQPTSPPPVVSVPSAPVTAPGKITSASQEIQEVPDPPEDLTSGRRRKAKAYVGNAYQIIKVYEAALARGRDPYEEVYQEFCR